jgi:hypothetical protein
VASRDGHDGEAETKKEDIIYYPRSSSGVSVFYKKVRNLRWCTPPFPPFFLVKILGI